MYIAELKKMLRAQKSNEQFILLNYTPTPQKCYHRHVDLGAKIWYRRKCQQFVFAPAYNTKAFCY